MASSDTGAAEALVGATEPALTRRLRTILHVEAQADDFPYAVERAFAALGRRSVACLVVPSSAAIADVWDIAREYAEAGAATRLGVVVSTPAELAAATALPDLGYLEVRGDGGAAWAREHDDALTALAETGVVVSVGLGDAAEALPLDLAEILRPAWVTSLVVACDDEEQLVSCVAALA